MYKLTVEFATKEELQNFLGGVQTVVTPDKPKRTSRAKKNESDEPATATTVKRDLARAIGSTPAAVAEYIASAVAPNVAPVSGVNTPIVDQGGALDYAKDVTPVMIAYSTNKGKDAFVALLDAFGVGTARELTPDQFAPFINEMNTQLGM
ncbi:MAG: hypothetical protein V3U75_13490 [Methylococcaceae bacterium]